MTKKSEEFYRLLFSELSAFAEQIDIQLMPSRIITDFELAPINASRCEFSSAINKGCYFHFCQSGWRKIQQHGLVVQYGNDIHFSLMIRHLFALAFLPASDIPSAFDVLKVSMPSEANDVVKWFEEYYVHGKVRSRLRNGTIASRALPLFPPQLWSVYDSIELGVPRTQNIVEAWHNR
jgi:hypothetical protein